MSDKLKKVLDDLDEIDVERQRVSPIINREFAKALVEASFDRVEEWIRQGGEPTVALSAERKALRKAL